MSFVLNHCRNLPFRGANSKSKVGRFLEQKVKEEKEISKKLERVSSQHREGWIIHWPLIKCPIVHIHPIIRSGATTFKILETWELILFWVISFTIKSNLFGAQRLPSYFQDCRDLRTALDDQHKKRMEAFEIQFKPIIIRDGPSKKVENRRFFTFTLPACMVKTNV